MTRAPMAERTLRASAWAQTAPNRPVEAPTTAAGLLRRGDSASGPGEPVEGVLELARDRVVVLGGRDQDCVRSGDRVEERLHLFGASVLVVLVERRDQLEPVELDELGLPGQQVARRPEELGVVGAGAQAAGETEDLHRITRRPSQLEVDEQLDLVGEREAALGQRGVPVEAVLGAVDDRLELEADLLDAAEGLVRLGDRRRGPRSGASCP